MPSPPPASRGGSARSYSRIGSADLAELHDAQTNWAAKQAAGLEEYLRRRDPKAQVEPAWPYIPHTLTTIEGAA